MSWSVTKTLVNVLVSDQDTCTKIETKTSGFLDQDQDIRVKDQDKDQDIRPQNQDQDIRPQDQDQDTI